jgi:MFS family permease
MLVLFVLTIFLSAGLLFLVQPMAAKMILPLLGGSAAVWTTCMLFFQALLLAGYLYGHMVDRWLRPSRQILVHLLVMMAACASLFPLGIPENPTALAIPSWIPSDVAIVAWILLLLAMAVGSPFFVVSTTGPLLQRWFSRTGHVHAKDPYFLYAASNAGSLIGLGAYPLLMEPLIGVRTQGWVWSYGYLAFVVLSLACGLVVYGKVKNSEQQDAPPTAPTSPPIAKSRLAYWIVLAAVPSSLMLGVTQQVATDLASVPLLWIIPLALYLVTFIVAFSPTRAVKAKTAGWAISFLIPATLTTMVLGFVDEAIPLVMLHFATFFVATYMCHRRLAEDRPDADRLTTFYLMLAVGGVLGGIFNSLLAPMLFDNVYEYPIAMVAALLLRPSGKVEGESTRQRLIRTYLAPAGAVVLAVGVTWMFHHGHAVSKALGPNFSMILSIIQTVPILLISLLVVRRPKVFAACIAIYAGMMYTVRLVGPSLTVFQGRSFFGVARVLSQSGGMVNVLSHGTTTHGAQIVGHEGVKMMPTTYYHPTGPVGQIFSTFGNDPRLSKVGVIGLGAGAIAAYSQPGDEYTFYEIDELIQRIASGDGFEEPFFTYLKNSYGRVEVVLADGRQGIAAHAKDGQYGLIVIDAFSSDAIPVHLITKEAIELYLTKLMPGGFIMLHTSNRHFNLLPVIARLATEVNCSLAYIHDQKISKEEAVLYKNTSEWVIMTRDLKDLQPLLDLPDSQWHRVRRVTDGDLWTDDHTNILKIFK